MSVVYLIACPAVGMVKIGYSKCAKQRLVLLQTGSPHILELVDTRKGDRKLEAQAHTLASAYRFRGEWFHDVAPVRAAFYTASVPLVSGARVVAKPMWKLMVIIEQGGDISPYLNISHNNLRRLAVLIGCHSKKTGVPVNEVCKKSGVNFTDFLSWKNPEKMGIAALAGIAA